MAMVSPYAGRYSVRDLNKLRLFPGKKAFLGRNRFLLKAPQNALPADLEHIKSSDKRLAGPALTRRLIQIVHQYKHLPNEAAPADVTRLEARAGKINVRVDYSEDKNGNEQIKLKVVIKGKARFGGIARKVSGEFVLKQTSDWRAGDWQGVLLNAFPIRNA